MARYAVIDAGKVINVIEWDGVAEWLPPVSPSAPPPEEGKEPVRCIIVQHDEVQIGWEYDAATQELWAPAP